MLNYVAVNNNSFISSTPILIAYISFSCFIHWLGLPGLKLPLEWQTTLNVSGDRGHRCPVVGLSPVVHCSYLKASLLSLDPRESPGKNLNLLCPPT